MVNFGPQSDGIACPQFSDILSPSQGINLHLGQPPHEQWLQCTIIISSLVIIYIMYSVTFAWGDWSRDLQ